MPTLLDVNLVQQLYRFPVPTVKYYAALSLALLAAVLYRTEHIVSSDSTWLSELQERMDNDTMYLSARTKHWLMHSHALKCFYFMITDTPSSWVVINTFCCAVASLGSLLRWLVFGKLRASETQQLQDRFWEFVFYKFVFVFGILNAVYVDEVMLWCVWFMFIALFHLLVQLAQDRFKYMNSSRFEVGQVQHWRILILMAVTFVCSIALFLTAAVVSYKFGICYGSLLACDSLALIVGSLYACTRYAVYLYELGSDRSDYRMNLTYHTELGFEVVLLAIDLLQQIHMLISTYSIMQIWSHYFLSLASLVVLMHLKGAWFKLNKRLNRHAKFKRIVKSMDQLYPTLRDNGASLTELDDTCAICWDPLEPTARQLPCKHAFHHWCLLGWLQQDASCPTCRASLPLGPSQQQDPNQPQQPNGQPRTMPIFNHMFRFDGRQYARWLPSFSVQVSHDYANVLGLLNRPHQSNALESRFVHMTAQAARVHELFPQVQTELIAADLQANGGHINVTINNILDGHLTEALDGLQAEDVTSSDGITDSDESQFDDDDSDDEGESSIESYNGEAAAPNNNNNNSSGDGRVDAAGGNGVADGAGPSVQRVLEPPAVPDPAAVAGWRFSKQTDERMNLLSERKHALIQQQQRLYLERQANANNAANS